MGINLVNRDFLIRSQITVETVENLGIAKEWIKTNCLSFIIDTLEYARAKNKIDRENIASDIKQERKLQRYSMKSTT